mmetsp:Transcript_1970/g.3057  ORF Transcript_1970/g.3057 Transcript_1970/m.3057 type:complete len:247 (-) Transcript_1970:866-1606(-)
MGEVTDFDTELKVLVVGNGGVGKTSMIRRFCKGVFTDEYKKTIGVDFLEKSLYTDELGCEVRFMCWDTAGQDEFDSIVRAYFRGAGACVLAFSTTDRDSFDAIAKWKSRVEAECGDIAMALIQNKVDLVDQATASGDEVEGMARKLGLKLYRTCVKENINVTEVFMYLAELHQKKLASGQLGQVVGGPAKRMGSTPSSPAPKAGSNINAFGGNVEEPEGQARTVELGPSKMRTGGKKTFKSKFSSC